jgi:Ca-activated chloride channel family protein
VKECDRLSLVTYDTNVYLDFSLTSMSRTNKDKTKITISKLRDGSSTNLCGGLVRGMEEVVQSAGERAQVQSVLLLTDGLANQGVRDTEGILAKMRELQDPPVHGDVAPKVRARLYVHGIYLCLLMVL